ncbi:hypothetical protein ACFL1H_04185 [Nanoarchaeota archaeon]
MFRKKPKSNLELKIKDRTYENGPELLRHAKEAGQNAQNIYRASQAGAFPFNIDYLKNMNWWERLKYNLSR